MISPIELSPTGSASLVKSIRVTAGARKQAVFRLINPDGQAADLTSEVLTAPAAKPEFTDRPVSGGNLQVKLVAKIDFNEGTPAFEVTGQLVDGTTDCVEFILESEHTSRPGAYLAEVGQFVRNGTLVYSWPCYVIVEPSAFQTLVGSGPLTLAEIRLAIQDLENGEVSLLDDVEFTDVHIVHAMRRAIDMWNETAPQIQPYTAMNFPYRYHWTVGTVGFLLDSAAARYRRDRLAYSAGGVSIDDQNKSQEYQAMADAKLAEYRQWMMREKLRLNMDAIWATF
jgi:hypothetical protein